MNYVQREVENNEREFWERDIARPQRVLNPIRSKIARVARLQPLEILKRITRPRRAA